MGQAGLGLGAVRENGTERRSSDCGEDTGRKVLRSYNLATTVSEYLGLGLRSLSDFTGEYGQAGPILPLSVV